MLWLNQPIIPHLVVNVKGYLKEIVNYYKLTSSDDQFLIGQMYICINRDLDGELEGYM